MRAVSPQSGAFRGGRFHIVLDALDRGCGNAGVFSFRNRADQVEVSLMKPDQIAEALEQAATQLGVRVRYEAMTGESAGAGGLCRIRGEWTIMIDRKATPSDRAGLLVEALAGFDVDAVYLAPEIREALVLGRARIKAATATVGVGAPLATPDDAIG